MSGSLSIWEEMRWGDWCKRLGQIWAGLRGRSNLSSSQTSLEQARPVSSWGTTGRRWRQPMARCPSQRGGIQSARLCEFCVLRCGQSGDSWSAGPSLWCRSWPCRRRSVGHWVWQAPPSCSPPHTGQWRSSHLPWPGPARRRGTHHVYSGSSYLVSVSGVRTFPVWLSLTELLSRRD